MWPLPDGACAVGRTAHVRYGTTPTQIAPPAEPSPIPAGGCVPPMCTTLITLNAFG
jgi:hypothetical protein